MHIRANRTEEQQKKPLIMVRLQQSAALHKRYAAEIPWWRQAWMGYLLCIPFVALGLLLVFLQHFLLPHVFFPSPLMVLPVLLIAIFWGVGPALVCALLCTLTMDYFYVPPYGQISFQDWQSLLEIMPFFLVEIGIAIIAGQREAARRRALFAEQNVQIRAIELEQINQELKEASQLKDRFLSMASHELKTPITTIRGQAQLALRRLKKTRDLPPGLEDVRASLQKIDEQTYRLNELIDDMLAISSIQSGKVKLRKQLTDLRTVCHDVVEDQQLISERRIQLNVPEAPVNAMIDAQRLSQVVTNLVSNALKYSPEESVVQVTVARQQKHVVMSVHDEGGGISSEQQQQIFEVFYRTPEAQASPKNGWGLGLAICKDIVERHGGRIWCESDPKQGTTFTVELPER